MTPSPFLLRQHQTPFLGGSRWASSIKFLGKDRWQGHASEPGPHPEVTTCSLTTERSPFALCSKDMAENTSLCGTQQAPKEFKDDFGSFHQKSIQDWTPPPQANAASSSGRGIEFWELPTRFQRSFLEEPEMACVEVSGSVDGLAPTSAIG